MQSNLRNLLVISFVLLMVGSIPSMAYGNPSIKFEIPNFGGLRTDALFMPFFSGQIVNLQLNGISTGAIPDAHDFNIGGTVKFMEPCDLTGYREHMSDYVNVFGAMYENRGFTATTAAGSSVGGGGSGDYLP